ncbi:MAG: TIGR00300 family protein [Acidimicrobiia bacterium]|nr:TIGR00300 family protein [Acidimicrobiia bacterium]
MREELNRRETVVLEGHIVDSLILPKVLDLILEAGAEYEVVELDMGRTTLDPSLAHIRVFTADDDAMEALLEQLHVHGANRLHDEDASMAVADQDGVLPVGFYSTTNLPTGVRIDGVWVPVDNPEMDCAIVVGPDGARTAPMHHVRTGDKVVVGGKGVRVQPLPQAPAGSAFEFMASDVSSEKPKALLVAKVAEQMRAARQTGGRVLTVAGPAVVHTGGSRHLARLVRDGWIDVLFAGNGLATHDVESNVLGTSLGVSVAHGAPTEGGHSNHVRVINEIRRHGSIAQAVDAGYLRGGVMYECIQRDVPFVLAGSVRDDGPLPDTITDVVEAADAMRALVPGVTVALMLATTLHAIATGNMLPAGVVTFCVDINQAVVTKLADRGSHQAMGIVTDVGPFLGDLAEELGA